MEVISQSLEPTMKAIQSATALLESLKELNKTDNFLVNNLLVPEVSRITSLQTKLVSLLETMQ
jgi:hypothetical protein